MDTLYVIMLIIGVVGLTITELKLYKQENEEIKKNEKLKKWKLKF